MAGQEAGLGRGRGEGAVDTVIVGTPTGALGLDFPEELFHIGCNGEVFLAQPHKSLNKDKYTKAGLLGWVTLCS